ncbi:hypothetical protein [Janthinobacterium psychrotolerans]|uniref:Uncharacterized protein n=1 Tax=Janthinobacterium psychrotolerans TaxID=1747903 RepID=A0A1A7C4I2_9BURK|nr:hypothetical protein [Janthinobacterium psychrotolerans]OBV39655.1 hypothetical protein ASR47_101144 [Janthinobacterium psychrotolerans]
MRRWIGIACAGWLCAVSPGHAQEVQTAPPAAPAHEQPAALPQQDTAPAPAQDVPADPAAPAAPADEPVASELLEVTPQSVKVTASNLAAAPRVRFTAYRDSYLTAKKVWQVSRGNVVMALRLIPAKLSATIDDVRVALQGDGAPMAIKVGEGGVFIVPINDEIAAQDGSFLVNKGRGELTANMVIQPAVARDAWTMARVAQVLHDARLAVHAITPWYKRLFASEIRSLAFCAPERGSALQLMQDQQLIATLPMNDAAVNDINQPVYCKAFDGQDKYPGQYRVVLPEQATVLLL